MADPAYTGRKRGRILTADQVCEFLSITPRQLKRAIVDRRIPVIPTPFGIRVTRFFEEDILAGLERARREPMEARPRATTAGKRRSKTGGRA